MKIKTTTILKVVKFFGESMSSDLSEYDCFSDEYKKGYASAIADMNWMIDHQIAQNKEE